MPTVASNRNVSLPTPHESSSLRPARDSDDLRQAYKRQIKHREQVSGDRVAVDQLTRQVEKIRRRILGGAAGSSPAGWFWIKGKRKYNPTVDSYKESQIVKILNDDDVVVTGLVCTGSAIPVKATPGKWVALQAVPVLKNDGTDNPAMIPQLPMPAGTDPDNAGNYWEFISPATVCVGGVPTDV